MPEWLTTGLRFALYLDLSLVFGLAAFGLHSLRGAERGFGTILAFGGWLTTAAALGLAVSGLALGVLAAAMGGGTLADVDRTTIEAVWDMPVGTAWLVRMAALIVAGLAAAGRSHPTARLATITLAGAIALGTLAWTGHGAATEGRIGIVHLAADIVHLLAAGLWLGALVGLGLLVGRRAARADGNHLMITHRALSGFAAIGTGAVAAIVLTGLINGWVLVGPQTLAALSSSAYGQLLLAKLVLFVGMLALAAANRFRLTPALAGSLGSGAAGQSLRALRLSVAAETACAIAILALVAWLGTLAPPAL